MAKKEEQLPGLLVVLSGAAGVGKTTVALRLTETPGFTKSVSATTRAPRAGEKQGKDYDFVSPEAFRALMAKGELIEFAEVHGNFYGTRLQPLREALARNEVMLMVIDVNGGLQVKEKKLDALLIFLKPPSHDELTRRLEKRATESVEEQLKRLGRATEELKVAEKHYDEVLVNGDLKECVSNVSKLIEKRRRELLARRKRGEKLYPGLNAN